MGERVEGELGDWIEGEVSVDLVDHWFGDGYFELMEHGW